MQVNIYIPLGCRGIVMKGLAEVDRAIYDRLWTNFFKDASDEYIREQLETDADVLASDRFKSASQYLSVAYKCFVVSTRLCRHETYDGWEQHIRGKEVVGISFFISVEKNERKGALRQLKKSATRVFGVPFVIRGNQVGPV